MKNQITQEQIELYEMYKNAYYEGNPVISDAEFDAFEQSLIEQGFEPYVGETNNLTNRKLPHAHKMLSLKKRQATTQTIPLEIANEIVSTYGYPGVVSWKFDGMAANITYVNGLLQSVVSRGNGAEGRDLTYKVKNLLPQQLNVTSPQVEIRAEIYMRKSNFEKYKHEQSNPRNLVAGIIRNEDKNDTRVNDLSFAIIEALDIDGKFIDPTQLHEFYKTNYKETWKIRGAKDLFDAFIQMHEMRENNDFPTDGIVYSSQTHEVFEHDGKYPDHAISIKFMPPETISTITDITWKLHKTGRYSPILHFEPVYIDGRKISKASGHNVDYLLENKCVPGSKVKIEIANDIIPMAKALNISTQNVDTSMLKLPEDSYISGCNVIALNDNDVEYLAKLNILKSFPIFGIGTEMYRAILANDEVYENPFVVFSPDFDFNSLEVGPGTLHKFKGGIEEYKRAGIGFSTIVKTLNIDGCGKTMTEQFTRYYFAMNYSTSGLTKDVWNILVNSMQKIDEIIDMFDKFGYTVYNDASEETSAEGKIKVVLTGSPKSFGFKTKAEYLAAHPEYVEVDKMQDADFLITDDLNSTSSKMSKAKKLDINIKTY